MHLAIGGAASQFLASAGRGGHHRLPAVANMPFFELFPALIAVVALFAGIVRRVEIGIRAQTITPELASGLLLARDHGVILADVIPGSPAAQAGLRPGDMVVALDGKPTENGRQLHVNLYRRLIGDVIALDVLRDGQTLRIAVAMDERHDPFSGLKSADPRRNLVPQLGILGFDLDQRLATMLPVLRCGTV